MGTPCDSARVKHELCCRCSRRNLKPNRDLVQLLTAADATLRVAVGFFESVWGSWSRSPYLRIYNDEASGRVRNRVILYDGVCVLCSYSVRFVIKRDVAGRFRVYNDPIALRNTICPKPWHRSCRSGHPSLSMGTRCAARMGRLPCCRIYLGGVGLRS